jgi:hypothetical protein
VREDAMQRFMLKGLACQAGYVFLLPWEAVIGQLQTNATSLYLRVIEFLANGLQFKLN